MSFLELLKIEFIKVKRGKIIPLIFIAPLLVVASGILVANTPLWIVYPYCYSGYLVSCALHDFTAKGVRTGFTLFPFLPCAILIFALVFAAAVARFGKKEMK